MDNFDEDITEIEIIELYREVSIIGNGKVDFDSFLLTANERQFFCRRMKVFGMNQKPKLTFMNEFDLETKEGRIYK